MLHRIMDLAAAMDGGDWDEELMRSMCQTAMVRRGWRWAGCMSAEMRRRQSRFLREI